ncbi:hypothetical protein [Desulfocastanea catecholica]
MYKPLIRTFSTCGHTAGTNEIGLREKRVRQWITAQGAVEKPMFTGLQDLALRFYGFSHNLCPFWLDRAPSAKQIDTASKYSTQAQQLCIEFIPLQQGDDKLILLL